MSMPIHQNAVLATFLMKQKLLRRKKFALLLELEPLFACNLKCAGCGKIAQPAHLLKQRMPVEQAIAAVEECGAPMVSIAGGEPLMHPQIEVMVNELLARGRSSSSAPTPCSYPSTCTASPRTRTSPGWSTSTGCASGTTSR